MEDASFTFVPSLLDQLKDFGDDAIDQIAWSPWGKSLAATSSSGRIIVWRRDQQHYIQSNQTNLIDGGKSKPLCLAWSHSGNLLVSGWSDGRIRVYQQSPFKLVRQSDALGPIVSVSTHPQSSVFITASQAENRLRLWNTMRKKLQPSLELPPGEAPIWDAVWHPGGKHLATCGADERIRIWSYEEKPPALVEVQHVGAQARRLVWSPDPDLLLARIESHGRVELWRTRQKNTVTLYHSDEVSSVAFSPDGAVCITKSADGKILLWKCPSGEFLGYVENKKAPRALSQPLPVELAVRVTPTKGEDSIERQTSVSTGNAYFDLANADSGDRCIRFWRLHREDRVTIRLSPPPPSFAPASRTKPSPAPDHKTGPKKPPQGQAARKTRRRPRRFGGIHDGRTGVDQLGFEVYAEAVANFLTDPGTQPPLTVSVEGKWGAGKSSFMDMVREKIKAGATIPRPGLRGWFSRKWGGDPRLILSFNLWRHDKEEAVWAAFAVELLRQLRHQCGWKYLMRGWFILVSRRVFHRTAPLAAFRLLAWLILLVVSFYVVSGLVRDTLDGVSATQEEQALVSERGGGGANSSKPSEATAPTEDKRVANKKELKHSDIATSSSDNSILAKADTLMDALDSPEGLAILVLAVTLLLNAKQLLGNPIDLELGSYLRSTGWEGRVAVIESFHANFDQIVRDYARHRRVYVFIDDLDRCDFQRAADLMQAINLMISENPNMLFILGMDRMRVAAGLAVKFEKILPYLEPEMSEQERAFVGLEHSYDFIEKFIQIPFQLPQPSLEDIKRLLLSLDRPSTAGGPVGGDPDSPEVEVDFEHEATLLVAPALDWNPRRVKQFVNSFRLRAFIAAQTGLLAGQEGRPGKITVYQLGKLVALSLRWPFFLASVREHPSLLSNLEALARDPERKEVIGEAEERWVADEDLMALLRARSDSPDVSLAALNIELLLRVAPPAPMVESEEVSSS